MAGAEAEYRTTLAFDPKHVNAHYNLGLLLAEKGDAVEAEAEYRTVLALNPKHEGAHINLGILLKAMGGLVGPKTKTASVMFSC